MPPFYCSDDGSDDDFAEESEEEDYHYPPPLPQDPVSRILTLDHPEWLKGCLMDPVDNEYPLDQLN